MKRSIIKSPLLISFQNLLVFGGKWWLLVLGDTQRFGDIIGVSRVLLPVRSYVPNAETDTFG